MQHLIGSLVGLFLLGAMAERASGQYVQVGAPGVSVGSPYPYGYASPAYVYPTYAYRYVAPAPVAYPRPYVYPPVNAYAYPVAAYRYPLVAPMYGYGPTVNVVQPTGAFYYRRW